MSGPDVLVIGGGAAGVFAAWRASELGARVLLLEKTDRLGTKILISGGGKCNLAHDGPLEEVIRAFRPSEARFIRPACYGLPNHTIIEVFASRGLEVYTRPDGRVFPLTKTAKDVVAILEGCLHEAGVQVQYETPVLEICRDEAGVNGVRTEKGFVPCRHVVLATGGSSYPKTGSTGDGWPWAAALGHSIVKVRAALAPIYLVKEDFAQLSGVSLRDTLLKARAGGKEAARWRGDLLFTHKGISGPTALGVSRVVAERLAEGEVILEVDLAPGWTFEAASENLRKWAAKNPRKSVGGFLEGLVPSRLEPYVLNAAGLASEPAHEVSKKGFNRLVEALKALSLGPVKAVPLERGEVVAGGICLDEVDSKTMRSLRSPGLYPCGEVLDVAGPVGGYNLQAAFATGFLAGENAAKDALDGASSA